MRKIGILPSLAFALLLSCGSETIDLEDDKTTEAEVGTHVQCGCSIEGLGACGEYVEVNGAMVELVFPDSVDMGLMPFCGKDGLVANVEGSVVDGKYVATQFALIDQ